MSSDNLFLLENASWPALIVQVEGNILQASAVARKLFGNDLPGKPLGAIWLAQNEISAAGFLKGAAREIEKPFQASLRTLDRGTVLFNIHICVLDAGGTKPLLLQLFEAPAPLPRALPGSPEAAAESAQGYKQKLDCALQLTRTVALDFNNALTSLLGHASHILARIEASNPLRPSLIEIQKSAERAAEIANDLSSFSRQEKETAVQQSGNLNDLLRKTVEGVRGAAGQGISWNFLLEKRLYSAKFDEGKMQQALLKVIENAVQASAGDGAVTIGTRNLDPSEIFHDQQAALVPGSYVCIEIEDTGSGISAEALPRVFEPFFSTKKEKGHRGLGLAWVYGIVTNHGGGVAISSQPGKGTSVRIYLPAQQKIVRDYANDSGDLTGAQTILMIDDEDLLLTMGEMILSSYGYQVLTANTGKKGLDLFSKQAASIDLVITDLVMPQMSGRELINHLRKIDPHVRIICASGFVRPPASQEDEYYLQKPFAAQELLRKVKEVLTDDK